jgi:hypothetical protein
MSATKTLEWSELWTAMDAKPQSWIATTKDMFWQMLEAVPPRADTGSRFLVGEPQRHNEQGKAVYACFREVAGHFYARYLTMDQFFGKEGSSEVVEEYEHQTMAEQLKDEYRTGLDRVETMDDEA